MFGHNIQEVWGGGAEGFGGCVEEGSGGMSMIVWGEDIPVGGFGFRGESVAEVFDGAGCSFIFQGGLHFMELLVAVVDVFCEGGEEVGEEGVEEVVLDVDFGLWGVSAGCVGGS